MTLYGTFMLPIQIVSRSLTTFTVPTTNDVPFTEQAIYSAPNNIP